MELKTILFATDGSVESEVVCRAACDIAQNTGADLHILHAWKVHALSGAAPTLPGMPTATQQQAKRAHDLVEHQRRFAKERLQREVTAHVRHQAPVPAIRATALHLNADLVVVGGHVTRPLERLFTSGSVSESVLEHVGRPTLILHGDDCQWPPHDVVACNDGSEEADMAMTLGAVIAKALEASLHVVQVLPTVYSRRRSELVRDFADRVSAVVKLEGVMPTSTEIMFGNPQKTLAAMAREETQSLLTLGTRGRGRVPGAHMGSTAFHVLRASDGPVLIVPKAALHRAVSVAQLSPPVQQPVAAK